ncbi:uncharacterized protein LOC116001667 [Ipomoea triloba]|uniref:uncharacterized protein LOC116001667 n=1 Tax=Ipomoea triloba TaxID=35885 RepID=UPI00125E89C8|nr:uncharacterized protein LOC116001667 [Ipomoea triloba]
MATMKLSLVFILLFACTIPFQGVLADIICENLPTNACAFSVSSSGKRCVLENSIKDGTKVEYECKTSDVVVGSDMAEYIETDKCVSACGIDRKSVGMSSDTLLESTFIAKLCSPACYNDCPNIVDLYFNLAAGEGAYLPDMCQKAASHRRDMAELESNSDVIAPGNSDDVIAPGPDVEWTSPRRDMIQLESDDSADALLAADVDFLAMDVANAPTTADAPSADDVLAIDVANAPSTAADAPIADDVLAADFLAVDVVEAPVAETPNTQLRNARRAMAELLSNSIANADAPAVDDALTMDTPAPSPSYF